MDGRGADRARLLAVLGPLLAVALAAEAPGRLGSADWAAIRFTLVQAVLSALVSVVAAIPVARALARRRFVGRRLFVALMGAPFILPVIVAVLGLLAIFGRAGWLNAGLEGIGAGTVSIYGLAGIVLAHAFLNLPLAVRLILQAWLSVPSERIRLAASLGFSDADMRRHFERPILRGVLPGAFMIVFLICTTSFAVALILGGGPRATTVELAIYQAFRFEFDLGRAAMLGLIQAAICVAAGVLALGLMRGGEMGTGLDRPPMAWPGDTAWARVCDGVAIVGCGGVPDAAAVGCSVGRRGGDPWAARLGLGGGGAVDRRGIVLDGLGHRVGVADRAVRCAGARVGRDAGGVVDFRLTTGHGDGVVPDPVPDCRSGGVGAAGDGVRQRVGRPAVHPARSDPRGATGGGGAGAVGDALGLTGWARLRLAILPRLRRPLGFGAGLAAAFSMGDLGVIALFSAPGQATLPMEMYRLMGSYRTEDAEGAAVLLMLLALGLFWLFDRGGRVDARA
jgi:thiamine transport system permease protein